MVMLVRVVTVVVPEARPGAGRSASAPTEVLGERLVSVHWPEELSG